VSGLIKNQVTVVAGTTNNNIIAGEVFEFLSRPAAVRLLVSQTVVVGSIIEVDFNLGNVIGAIGYRPNVAAAAGVVDRDRDGVPAAIGQAGDRIQVRARETTGTAGNDGILNYILEITDLA
jgi:hypothetical protein